MAGQAPINRMNGYGDRYSKRSATSEAPPREDMWGGRRLLADLTELGELQVRLFSADLRATRQRATGPILYTAIGMAIVLGSMPVLLLSAAEALVGKFGWQSWAAHLVSGGVAVLCGLLALAIAYRKFTTVTEPIERSTSELAKTFAALKQMLGHSDSNTQSSDNGTP